MKISITELFGRLDADEKQELIKLIAEEEKVLWFTDNQDALDYVLEKFYPDEIMNRIPFDSVREYAQDNEDRPAPKPDAPYYVTLDENMDMVALGKYLRENDEVKNLLPFIGTEETGKAIGQALRENEVLDYMPMGTILEWVKGNADIGDVYDNDDILQYVKDNFCIDDVVDFC